MAVIATFYDHIRAIAKERDIPMDEALTLAREAGVEALEMSENAITGQEEAVSQLKAAGLAVSTVTFSLKGDEEPRRQGERLIKAAQAVGARRFMVIPGFWGEEDSPQQRREKTQRMIEGTAELTRLITLEGMSLTIEDFDNALSPVATAEGVRRFLDNCPGLTCAFDTGNFRFAGEDVLAAYDMLRDKITHLHLKDRAYAPVMGEAPRKAMDGAELYPAPVGGGDLPLKEVIKRLRGDGYDGVFAVEHYGAEDTLLYLRKSVGWVKEQLGM